MKKREITVEEINWLTDFIKPNPNIPEDVGMSVVRIQRSPLQHQLKGQMIYPDILPLLKDDIYRYYETSLIQSGENVGIVCAQSIGEKQTQTSLNTFHKAGQSEKTMTTGIPRFQELINATKNPKIINHKIYFNTSFEDIRTLRRQIGNKLRGIKLHNFIMSTVIRTNKTDESWYPSFYSLFSERSPKYKHAISITFNIDKLFEFGMTLSEISDKIEKTYTDTYCVFSPPQYARIDVFVDDSSIDISSDICNNNIKEDDLRIYYLSEVVIKQLRTIHICGIPNIVETFYLKQDDEWICETNTHVSSKGFNTFQHLLTLPCVDYTRTVSNNVWDIYESLDIEATRQFLINEFMSILNDINMCHTTILVDRMTYNGTISSITRYTLKNEDSGPLGKASFEETMDNFMNAAINCDVEPITGISASIICGIQAPTGTGMSEISIDMEAL